MKRGDLVQYLCGSVLREPPCTGVVVKMPFVGPNGETQQAPRVGVLWSNADGKVVWEPVAWLAEVGVINEKRLESISPR
jgi:hypothetical protein